MITAIYAPEPNKTNDLTGADLGDGWIGWLATPPFFLEEAKKKVLEINVMAAEIRQLLSGPHCYFYLVVLLTYLVKLFSIN